MHGEIETRDKVLLDAQLPDVERVAHILCVHHHVDFAVDGYRQLRRDNVIARFDLVGGVQAKIILVPFVNLVGMDGAEPAINARVPEVKSELARLGLDLQGIRPRRCEIDIGPRSLAKNTERQDLRAHKDERGRHHHLGAAWKILQLHANFAFRKRPDEKRQDELGEKKRDPRFSHSVRQLLVNLVAVGGDILRHHVHMGDDGIGRRQRDDHQNDCKQLTHGTSFLLSVYSDVISSFRQQSAFWEVSARDCEKGSIGLGFEYEVYAFRFTAGDGHFLRLVTVGLVVSGDRVLAWRQIGKRKATVRT